MPPYAHKRKTPTSGYRGDFWSKGVVLILACDDTIKKLKKKNIFFIKKVFSFLNLYQCFYLHQWRDSACPVCAIFFSLNRPHRADSVIELPCPSVWMSVCLRQGVQFFCGLSLALRSHDQFQASNWSSLPPSLIPPHPQ